MMTKPNIPSRFSMEPRPHERIRPFMKRAILAAIARVAIAMINKDERIRRKARRAKYQRN